MFLTRSDRAIGHAAMARIEKTVFISYRRTDESWALAIFQDLTQHGYDVFIDYDGIASGSFETAILENIKARAHFLVLLTPTALERCGDPKDWMRREIEAALDSQRNIVPLMLAGFNFGTPAVTGQLTGKLAALKEYNGLEIPKGYFSPAMERLRNKFLSVSLDTVLHPASLSALQAATEQKDKATMALGDALHQPWQSSEERRKQEEAAAQHRAEKQRRRQEAEDRRRVDEAEAERRRLEEEEEAKLATKEEQRRAQPEKERKREEAAANARAQAQREAEEQARRDKEQARLTAIAGLSPEQIAKAEELANWDFIKDSTNEQDFRDHLARFPGGICERMTRQKLANLTWRKLGEARDKRALESYLEEFPESPQSNEAKERLAAFNRTGATKNRSSQRVESQKVWRPVPALLTVGMLVVSAISFSLLVKYAQSISPPTAVTPRVEQPDATGADKAKTAEPEKQEPIEQLLAKADVARGGENAAKKCQFCHTFTKGGRNLVGPNLWGVVGRPKASEAGFNYSAAMKAKGGNWTIDDLNQYITNSRGFIPGTNMAFAGILRRDERADVIAYLNTLSDNPAPLPTAPPISPPTRPSDTRAK